MTPHYLPHKDHMTDVKESGDAVVNAACNIIQHDCFGAGSVMVSEGISLEALTDLHVIANSTRTATQFVVSLWMTKALMSLCGSLLPLT